MNANKEIKMHRDGERERGEFKLIKSRKKKKKKHTENREAHKFRAP